MISIFRSKTGLPRQEKAYSPYSFVNRRFEICSSVSLSRRGIRSAPVSGRGEYAAFSLKGQHFWHSSHPKISGVLRRIFFSSSFKTSFFCVRYDLHRHGLNRSWESAFRGMPRNSGCSCRSSLQAGCPEEVPKWSVWLRW